MKSRKRILVILAAVLLTAAGMFTAALAQPARAEDAWCPGNKFWNGGFEEKDG